MNLTQQYVCANFSYNAKSGKLLKLVFCAGIGDYKEVGTLRHGYKVISIENRQYPEHRLIWLYIHGYLPKEIDHIDNNPLNNRIENLREVTRSQNNWNSGLNSVNTSGYKGISLEEKYSRYKAYVKKFGKRVVKNFSYKNGTSTKEQCLEEAVTWVTQVRRELHGSYSRDR